MSETLFELPTPSTLNVCKRIPTGHQGPILDFIKMSGGECTKAQIVDKFGRHYYCGAENHIGAILCRMCKSGIIQRIKKGVYRTPEGPTT